MPTLLIIRHRRQPGSVDPPPASSFHFLLRQRGVTSIEYALLSALIALAILGAVSGAGSNVLKLWTDIAARVAAAIG